MTRLPRISPLAALAGFLVIAAAPAWGQAVTLSFTGTVNDAPHGFTAGGTGTLAPGGSASVSIAARNTDDNNCLDVLQGRFTITAASGDVLNLLFNATDFSQAGATSTLKASVVVTGGTGAYAGKGGSGTVTLVSTNATATSATYTLTGTVTLAGALVPAANIVPSGIVTVFGVDPVISPGSWISVYGDNLANGTAQWNGDFPTALGNVTATIDGKAAYFWFVSPAQINMQVPDGTRSGCVDFVLNTPNGTVKTQVEVEPYGPSLSMLDGRYPAAVIPTPNGTGAYGGGTYDLAGPVGRFSFATRPVRRGETVLLFGVGFGPTTPAVPAGKAFSGAAPAVNPLQVSFGDAQGNFSPVPTPFGGLVGAGLFQINTAIPQTAPTGDIPIQVVVQPSGGGNTPLAGTSGLNIFLPVQ